MTHFLRKSTFNLGPIICVWYIVSMEIPDFVSDVTKSSETSQPAPFLAAKLGDNVTVEYHVTSNVDHMVWYKMTTGNKLQCVAKAEIVTKHAHYFGDYINGRFGGLIKVGIFHLNMSSTKQEDIGIYYCVVLHLNVRGWTWNHLEA